MAKQLLFYENVAAITPERHRTWSVEQGTDFGFAAEINSCPLMVTEFHTAGGDLPIIFGKTDDAVTPMVILGIEPGKSLMVDGEGSWTGRYVPAFVRRYPFVFSKSANGETYSLCIDEAFAGCDAAGERGRRLFADDDKPSEYVEQVLEFAKSYETEHRRTRSFCDLIDQHGLLDPMNAQITMPDGQKRELTGFHVVSKERLKQLPDDVVKDFFARDVLELIYAHLLSLRNMERLRGLVA